LGLNALLILGPIVGVLLWYEKLSLQDIGLVWRKLPFAMLLWVAIWLLVQGIELVAGLLLQGNAEIDPAWSGGGLVVIALLVGHLLGTALYEEMAFRGFLLRQCFLNLRRCTKNRLVLSAAVAILVSQLAFTLFHVPWKLVTKGWSASMGGELWRSVDRDCILSPVRAHGQPVSGYGGPCARECAHFPDKPHHWDSQSAVGIHCCDLDTLAADEEMAGESLRVLCLKRNENQEASGREQALLDQ
jgi:membrane protease YdiL (CAAX protease family)